MPEFECKTQGRHRWRSPLPACVVAVALLASSKAAAQPQPVADAGRIADMVLSALVETNGVPGMSATVVRDGATLWNGVAGLRDVASGLPVEADTTFRFASVSKLITATAAMRLADQGRLDLDAPVQSVVPYLHNTWQPFTTRQLAAHTAGLPHYQEIDAARGGARIETVEESVALFSGRSQLSAPGARYNYSSWGYTLLSAVVEESADAPFLDYVGDELLADLDIEAERSTDPDASAAYEFRNGRAELAPAHDYSYSWGGAGFRGSARDLAHFGDRILSGVILSPSAREEMWTPSHLNDGSPVVADGDFVAFGWRVDRDRDGARIAHHAGVTVGARSVLVLYPDSGMSVSVLSNALWVASIRETAQMLAAPFQTQAIGEATACPVSAMRFEGSFHHQPIHGTARFWLDGGVCRGRIGGDNAFGASFNEYPQRDSSVLAIVATHADGQLARAALVTPAGVYDLRTTADGQHQVSLSSGRSLTIRFH